MSLTKRVSLGIVTFLVAAFAVGCSGTDGDEADGGGTSSGQDSGITNGSVERTLEGGEALGVEYSSDDAVLYDQVGAASGGGDTAVPQSRDSGLPEIGPKVIKTAGIGIEVERDSFRDSVQDAIDIAERHGGFVLSSDIGGSKTRSGSLILRVPAEQFETALGELKELGTKVTSESIQGQDVSQQFVDLSARLRNFQAQEAVLLDLMEEATSISESIRVQNELQRTQLEIERLQGRLNYLEDQTAFGTISLDVAEAGIAPPKPAGTLGKAWNDAKDAFLDVVSAVIVGAGFLIPVMILIALLVLVFRLIKPSLPSIDRA
ncbi:MAG: DUF4349 domain-containing protein [Actinomycetota bacterium]